MSLKDLYLGRKEDLPHRAELDVGRSRAVALFIGLLAMGLALGLDFLDGVWQPECQRASISHYFYEPRAGTAFVMALTIVAAFMVTYRGEKTVDRYVAIPAGIAAGLVAFFPTSGPGCLGQAGPETLLDIRPAMVVQAPGEVLLEGEDRDAGLYLLRPIADDSNDEIASGRVQVHFASKQTGFVHYGFAMVLFIALLYFVFYAFIRSNAKEDLTEKGTWTSRKWTRNSAYFLCGLVMIGGVIIIPQEAGFARISRPIYFGEDVFLLGFGISWLIKSKPWRGRMGVSMMS